MRENIFREPGELQELLPRPPSYLTPEKAEQLLLALEFLADVVSPEGYGHAVSDEVRKRASRILKFDAGCTPRTNMTTLHLRLGGTYCTKPNPDGTLGRAFTMGDMQIQPVPGGKPLKIFREHPGGLLAWTEGGGNISGRQDLALVMELHAPPAATPAPAPTPGPTPAPAAHAAAVHLGRITLRVEIDLDTMKVASAQIEH